MPAMREKFWTMVVPPCLKLMKNSSYSSAYPTLFVVACPPESTDRTTRLSVLFKIHKPVHDHCQCSTNSVTHEENTAVSYRAQPHGGNTDSYCESIQIVRCLSKNESFLSVVWIVVVSRQRFILELLKRRSHSTSERILITVNRPLRQPGPHGQSGQTQKYRVVPPAYSRSNGRQCLKVITIFNARAPRSPYCANVVFPLIQRNPDDRLLEECVAQPESQRLLDLGSGTDPGIIDQRHVEID